MKKIFLKSFCARFLTLLVLALLSTNLAWGDDVTLTENFSSKNASSDNYDCNSGIATAANQTNWNYAWTPDGSGTVFKNGIKLGKSGGTGSVSNSTMLKDIPAGTSITVKVYAAVWNKDGGKVKFTYNGNSETKDAANTAITSTSSTYNASNFASATEFSITKVQNVDEIKIESSTGRILIDKVEVVYVSVPAKTLQSIAVKTAPTTTSYNVGDKFNPAGLVITATYDTGDPEDIAYAGNEDKFSFSPALDAALATTDENVTITYGEKSVDQEITVNLIKLATPANLNATPASTSATLTWDEVANASSYEVKVMDGDSYNETFTPTTNSLLVEGLTASTEYLWSVKAIGDNVTYSDGDANEDGDFTTTALPTVAYIVYFDGNSHGTPASESITEAEAGAGITLPGCTPSEGYQFIGWATSETATEADAGEANATYHPTANITLYAVYNEIYTINYMVNGVNTNPQENVDAGTPLVFPEVSAPDADHVFCGWVTEEINEPLATAPEYVNTEGLTASEDATYYAVFAEKEEGEATWNKVTTLAGITEGTYVLVSEKTANTYKYMPNTESSGSNPTLGGGITIDNNVLTNEIASNMPWSLVSTGTTNEYYIRPYGNDKIGLGTTNSTGDKIRISSTYKDTKWTITTSASYNWQIKNNNTTAMYLAVYADEAWRNYSNSSTNQNGKFYFFKKTQNITYSNYCTTVPRTFTKTISNRKMATLYLDYAVEIPTGVKAYTAADKDDSHTAITLEKITDGVIPANTGVIIYSDIATDYTFTETTDAGSTYESNCLKGVTELTAFDAVADYNATTYNYYALMADGETSVVFKLVNGGSYAANSAYLVLPKTANAKVDFTFDDEPTGIESLTPALSEGKGVYNLQGVRVNNGYKGIVIMNGKKYINK